MTCPVCKVNNAEYDEYYGYLPCKPCQERQSRLRKPGALPEFTSDSIKEQRKRHAKDIEAPHRSGHLNKKWLDIYGKEAAKRHGFTDSEIKNAKYVYAGDSTYYKEDN